MPLSRPYGVTRPVVGQMFHVKHWLWCRWCFGRRRPRPPARLGDLASLGTASRSPPVPSGPSGALHTGDTWCARGRRPARSPSALRAFGSARRLEARPDPATAHGHRGQTQGAGRPRRALRSLRRPPHRRHLVCWRVAGRTPPPPIGTESGSSLEVFNQSPYPSIGISIPYGDRNCVIPSNHRQNSDICGAKC